MKQLSHEIGNPLQGLRTHAEIAQRVIQNKEFEVKPKIEKFIKIANKVINQISSVTSSMLKYTKSSSFEKEKHSINKIMEDVKYLLLPVANNHLVKLDVDLEDTLPEVSCNELRISLAFQNIILNAIQAINKKGEIRIRTENSRFISQNGATVEAAKISVKDSGKGMSEEQLKHLFDPFYTTKYEGYGLGLSIVFETINSHGGYINVKSILNEGSEFEVYLPFD